MEKKITVALPVYNGEKYILKALQSIALQSIKVDNILICDNKSTDNSLNIVTSFAKEHPGLDIKIHINPQNIGSLPNFNKCFELCGTKYLLILCIDDRLKVDGLEKLLNFHKENPGFAVVAGNVDLIDENERLIRKSENKKTVIFEKGQFLELVEETNLWIQVSAALFNMDCTRKIGFWDTSNIGGDERYWAQLLKHFPLSIISDSVTYQMVRKDQSGTKETLNFKDKIMHFETNMGVSDYETNPYRRKKMKKVLKKWAANHSIGIGRKLWKYYGKYRLSIKYWVYGIRQNPLILFEYRFYRIIAISVLRR